MIKQNTTSIHLNLQHYHCTQQTQQAQQKKQKTSHVVKYNSGQAHEKLSKTCSLKFKQKNQNKCTNTEPNATQVYAKFISSIGDKKEQAQVYLFTISRVSKLLLYVSKSTRDH